MTTVTQSHSHTVTQSHCHTVTQSQCHTVPALLVVKNDVRSPDVVSWDVEALDSAVLLRIPHQLVIPPELLNPQIGCHNLVLQVLKVARKEKR